MNFEIFMIFHDFRTKIYLEIGQKSMIFDIFDDIWWNYDFWARNIVDIHSKIMKFSKVMV